MAVAVITEQVVLRVVRGSARPEVPRAAGAVVRVVRPVLRRRPSEALELVDMREQMEILGVAVRRAMPVARVTMARREVTA